MSEDRTQRRFFLFITIKNSFPIRRKGLNVAYPYMSAVSRRSSQRQRRIARGFPNNRLLSRGVLTEVLVRLP